jgi:quinol monooxygenase YgiN
MPDTSTKGGGMVVAIGRVVTDADRRDELVRIGQRIAVASRAEPGCISYQVCQDSESENEFVFVEQWRSDDALREHFGTPHVAEFMAAIRNLIVAPPDVKFHTVASSRDLADVGSA